MLRMLCSGTAVWINAIIVNSASTSEIVIFTNITFELDNQIAGTYSHFPSLGASEYEYNVTVFGKTGLDNTAHTLTMAAVQGSQPSLLLFDWAIYTWVPSNTCFCMPH